MDQLIEQFSPILSSYVPTLVGAIGILVLGWILARLLASGTRGHSSHYGGHPTLPAFFFRRNHHVPKIYRTGQGI